MKIATEQNNEKLGNLVNQEDLEEDVDEMMKQLEREVRPRPAKIAVHTNAMEVESLNGVKVERQPESQEDMEVERGKVEENLN
jgi:hypothetical protein